MPKGVCPECGAVFYGWVLLQEGKDKCECGADLNVSIDNPKKMAVGPISF